MVDLSNHVLGETDAPVLLESSDDCREAAIALARQTRRTLCIFTHDLDAKVYGDREFVEVVSALARRHHLSWVRVLVQDPGRAIRGSHRLVELAQRLPSRVEIHVVGRQFKSYNRAFLLADDMGLLLRDDAIHYEGTAYFHNPTEARAYTQIFRKAWDGSATDRNLARLHL